MNSLAGKTALVTGSTDGVGRRVAERLGFRHEGTLRAVHPAGGSEPADLEVFGLLRSEWQRQERSA